MGAGRPESTLSDLPENWYNYILELYKEGAADIEVKALIYQWRGSFSNDLWDRWLKDEPQFSETIKTGRLLSESWWNKEGRSSLRDKDFSYTGWYMNMRNRFGWQDKTDLTTNGKDLPAATPPVINIISPNK